MEPLVLTLLRIPYRFIVWFLNAYAMLIMIPINLFWTITDPIIFHPRKKRIFLFPFRFIAIFLGGCLMAGHALLPFVLLRHILPLFSHFRTVYGILYSVLSVYAIGKGYSKLSLPRRSGSYLSAAVSSFLDMICLLNCIIVVLGIVQIPHLVHYRGSSFRGSAFEQMALTFYNVFIAFWLVLHLLAPWRIGHSYRDAKSCTNPFERRKRIIANGANAVLDLVVYTLCIPVALTLWRLPILVREIWTATNPNHARWRSWRQFMQWCIDVPCIAMGLATLALPWRFFLLLRHVGWALKQRSMERRTCELYHTLAAHTMQLRSAKRSVGKHFVVRLHRGCAYHFACAFVGDPILLALSAVLLLTGIHARGYLTDLRAAKRLSKESFEGFVTRVKLVLTTRLNAGTLEEIAGHRHVRLFDVLTLVSPDSGAPHNVRSSEKPLERFYPHAMRAALRRIRLLLCDLPFVVLGIPVAFAPWRVYFFVQDLRKHAKQEGKAQRWWHIIVFRHLILLVLDPIALVCGAVVVLTGWRALELMRTIRENCRSLLQTPPVVRVTRATPELIRRRLLIHIEGEKPAALTLKQAKLHLLLSPDGWLQFRAAMGRAVTGAVRVAMPFKLHPSMLDCGIFKAGQTAIRSTISVPLGRRTLGQLREAGDPWLVLHIELEGAQMTPATATDARVDQGKGVLLACAATAGMILDCERDSSPMPLVTMDGDAAHEARQIHAANLGERVSVPGAAVHFPCFVQLLALLGDLASLACILFICIASPLRAVLLLRGSLRVRARNTAPHLLPRVTLHPLGSRLVTYAHAFLVPVDLVVFALSLPVHVSWRARRLIRRSRYALPSFRTQGPDERDAPTERFPAPSELGLDVHRAVLTEVVGVLVDLPFVALACCLLWRLPSTVKAAFSREAHAAYVRRCSLRACASARDRSPTQMIRYRRRLVARQFVELLLDVPAALMLAVIAPACWRWREFLAKYRALLREHRQIQASLRLRAIAALGDFDQDRGNCDEARSILTEDKPLGPQVRRLIFRFAGIVAVDLLCVVFTVFILVTVFRAREFLRRIRHTKHRVQTVLYHMELLLLDFMQILKLVFILVTLTEVPATCVRTYNILSYHLKHQWHIFASVAEVESTQDGVVDWEHLPTEIVNKIFIHLIEDHETSGTAPPCRSQFRSRLENGPMEGSTALVAAGMTCQRWHALAEQDHLWARLVDKRWGQPRSWFLVRPKAHYVSKSLNAAAHRHNRKSRRGLLSHVPDAQHDWMSGFAAMLQDETRRAIENLPHLLLLPVKFAAVLFLPIYFYARLRRYLHNKEIIFFREPGTHFALEGWVRSMESDMTFKRLHWLPPESLIGLIPLVYNDFFVLHVYVNYAVLVLTTLGYPIWGGKKYRSRHRHHARRPPLLVKSVVTLGTLVGFMFAVVYFSNAFALPSVFFSVTALRWTRWRDAVVPLWAALCACDVHALWAHLPALTSLMVQQISVGILTALTPLTLTLPVCVFYVMDNVLGRNIFHAVIAFATAATSVYFVFRYVTRTVLRLLLSVMGLESNTLSFMWWVCSVVWGILISRWAGVYFAILKYQAPLILETMVDFIEKPIRVLRRIFAFARHRYTRTLVLATRLCSRMGIVGNLVHLPIVIAWIFWPLAPVLYYRVYFLLPIAVSITVGLLVRGYQIVHDSWH